MQRDQGCNDKEYQAGNGVYGEEKRDSEKHVSAMLI